MSLALCLRPYFLGSIALTLTAVSVVSVAQQPTLSRNDRDTAQDMLRIVGNDVRKHYYDPKFHGVNWDVTLQAGKPKIDSSWGDDGVYCNFGTYNQGMKCYKTSMI